MVHHRRLALPERGLLETAPRHSKVVRPTRPHGGHRILAGRRAGAGELAGSLLGAPVLAVGYAALATVFLVRFHASFVARCLVEVGRMALTNYLLQSIIMTVIFYGLGLYEHVGLAAALGLCAIPYAANLVFSHLWLNHFSHGPAEWPWRRLTYGKSPASD